MGFYVRSLPKKKKAPKWKVQFVSYRKLDYKNSKSSGLKKEWDIQKERWRLLGFLTLMGWIRQLRKTNGFWKELLARLSQGMALKLTLLSGNFSRYFAIFRVLKRIAMHYNKKTRAEMPDGCTERFDFSFIKWIWKYPSRNEKIREFFNENNVEFIEIKNKRQFQKLLGGNCVVL
jgi:hypothetical protein